MDFANKDLILAREFPGDVANSMVLRSGQFHDVYVGATKVVSIAKTQVAASRLPDRALKLKSIAEAVPAICIPQVLAVHEDYLVMTRVPGVPFAELNIAPLESTSTDIALALGSLLQTLSDIEPRALEASGFVTTPANRWGNLAKRVEASLLPMMSATGSIRALREMTCVANIVPVVTGLIHGDLGGDNIHWVLENGRPIIAGVLDWDEAQLGDIAVDLAALRATFDAEVIEQITVELGLARGVLQRMNAIRGTFALQQALAGFEDNDQEAVTDGLREYI